MPRLCTNGGHKNADDADFCGYCGMPYTPVAQTAQRLAPLTRPSTPRAWSRHWPLHVAAVVLLAVINSGLVASAATATQSTPARNLKGVIGADGGHAGMDEKRCYWYSANERYNSKVVLVALGKANPCMTYPYLGEDYDAVGNSVHAGIDFRASLGDPVFSVESGHVVEVADPATTGNLRSTLIIENEAKTRKAVYLHMSKIRVKKGDSVDKGMSLGEAGMIGADAVHLHLEVWPVGKRSYDNKKAFAGANASCSPEIRCELWDIKRSTLNPLDLIQLPDEQSALASRPKVPYIQSNPPFSDLSVTPEMPVVLKETGVLYSQSSPTSRVIQKLSTGTATKGLSLQIHTNAYQLLQLKTPGTVKFTSGFWTKENEVQMTLRRGEILAVLHYWGEGECAYLVQGRVLGAMCPGEDDSFPETESLNSDWQDELWVQVKTGDGQVGWLRNPTATGLSKHD